MPERPKRAEDYDPQTHGLARAGLLHLATVFGDLLDDMLVVGGLVPGLIAPVPTDDAIIEAHVGTRDVDIALSLALLDEERYTEIAKRLRRAGFEPDVNDRDHPTVQRWVLHAGWHVTVDFLIPPTASVEPGKIQHLGNGLGALVTRGLTDADRTRVRMRLDGLTLNEEVATRNVWVCGPAGFVILKALAFRNRGEGKDAYDLFYVIKHHADRPEGVAATIARLRASEPAEPEAIEDALRILHEDFGDVDSVGPKRAGEFLSDGREAEVAADVVAHVVALLREIERLAR